MAYARSRQVQYILSMQATLGLTRQELAAYFGTSWRTTSRRRAHKIKPRRSDRDRYQELKQLADLLRDTFKSPEAIHEWMRTENLYLGGLTPAEVIRAGRVDRVIAAIGALESGIHV